MKPTHQTGHQLMGRSPNAGLWAQDELFTPQKRNNSEPLMQAMDDINKRYGRGSVFIAAQGINKPWVMKQDYLSPKYTTKWEELPVVIA